MKSRKKARTLYAMTAPACLTVNRPSYEIRFTCPERVYTKKKLPPFVMLFPGKDECYFTTAFGIAELTKRKFPFEIVREVYAQQHGIVIGYPAHAVLHALPPASVLEEIMAYALSRQAKDLPCVPCYLGTLHRRSDDAFVFNGSIAQGAYYWRWQGESEIVSNAPLKGYFPKLVSIVKDPRTRFVVSLGSGGFQMFAHPLGLRLLEELGLKEHVDELWGTSAGALMGMAWSMGATGLQLEHYGREWCGRADTHDLQPRWLPFVRYALWNYIAGDTLDPVSGFINVRSHIETFFSAIKCRQNPQFPVYALAWNLNANKLQALTSCASVARIHRNEIVCSAPLDAVLASTAIPVIFPPHSMVTDVEHVTYIDASMFEELPLTSVLCKWRKDKQYGLTKKKKLFVFAINLFPRFSTLKLFRRFPFRHMDVLHLMLMWSRMTDRARLLRLHDQQRFMEDCPDARMVMLTVNRRSQHTILDPDIIPLAVARARESFFDQLTAIEKKL